MTKEEIKDLADKIINSWVSRLRPSSVPPRAALFLLKLEIYKHLEEQEWVK